MHPVCPPRQTGPPPLHAPRPPGPRGNRHRSPRHRGSGTGSGSDPCGRAQARLRTDRASCVVDGRRRPRFGPPAAADPRPAGARRPRRGHAPVPVVRTATAADHRPRQAALLRRMPETTAPSGVRGLRGNRPNRTGPRRTSPVQALPYPRRGRPQPVFPLWPKPRGPPTRRTGRRLFRLRAPSDGGVLGLRPDHPLPACRHRRSALPRMLPRPRGVQRLRPHPPRHHPDLHRRSRVRQL